MLAGACTTLGTRRPPGQTDDAAVPEFVRRLTGVV